MAYVDPLIEVRRTKFWPYTHACHMVADSTEELVGFATRLGLRRSWMQHPGKYSEHYDLTSPRRAEAVNMGAIEISHRELVEKMRAKRGR